MPLNLTALDLITLACQEVNICGQNGDLDGSDAEVARQHLNLLIDGTNIKRAVIYTVKSQIFPLIAGQQDYTIGKDPTGAATANFDADRPTGTESANVLVYSGSTTTRIALQQIGDAEWSAISVQAVSGLPQRVYNDGGYAPNGFSTLKFWPKPDQAYGYEQYTWQQNGYIALLSDPINYPPDYANYWLYGLAMRLFVPFGKPVNPDTRAQFRDAEASLANRNLISPLMSVDVALSGGKYGTSRPWLTGPYYP